MRNILIGFLLAAVLGFNIQSAILTQPNTAKYFYVTTTSSAAQTEKLISQWMKKGYIVQQAHCPTYGGSGLIVMVKYY